MTAELIEKLERGEVGREIEVAIYRLLHMPPEDTKWDLVASRMSTDELWDWISYFRSEWVNVTTSLDAAIALVERVRPGWVMSIDNAGDGCSALLLDREQARNTGAATPFKGSAPTLATALIAALLKAEGK